MASAKQAYMPQDSHSMMPQFFQDATLRSNVGAKSGIWSTAPPATPQSSSASMSSVWGSPLSVLPSSSSSGTAGSSSKGNGNAISTAFRSHSSSTLNEVPRQSLAALAADSEPVVSNDTSVSSFVPSLSSASSRLSSRQNSQTDISSPVMANGVPMSTVGPISSASGVSVANPPHSKSMDQTNDEIINTAIVVKNIPFAIKKEQLIDFMTQLGLPLPYAFNYHFDNGVFRGLAFANFTTADETAAVITTLNGRELGGRKLRVEYKKMLPFQERERIEREKRERRGQLEEQHQQSSHAKQQVQPHNQKFRSDAAAPHMLNSTEGTASQPQTPGVHAREAQPMLGFGHLASLDMNNPETIRTFTSLLLFKQDSLHSDLTVPAYDAGSLGGSGMNDIRVLCRALDLNVSSVEEQGIIISKRPDSRESEGNSYLSGIFKNSSLTSSGTFSPDRLGFNGSGVNPASYSPANSLNRWNGMTNYPSMDGSKLGTNGPTLAPR